MTDTTPLTYQGEFTIEDEHGHVRKHFGVFEFSPTVVDNIRMWSQEEQRNSDHSEDEQHNFLVLENLATDMLAHMQGRQAP